MTTDNLYGKPTRCHACPLFDQPGIVPGHGPEDASIMIVGEAPGAEETVMKRPFVGGSGRVLNRMLWQAGLERNAIYVTNVVKCRPQGNRTPTDEEMRCCAPFLIDEIKTVKPNVILVAGNTPLYALTDKNGIFKHRGVPLEGALGTKVVGMLHPAAVMRQQHLWPLNLFDIQRASAEQFTRTITRYQADHTIDASPERDFPALLRDIRATGRVIFDLETTNLDPRTSSILCIGLGARRGQAHSYRWTPSVAQLVSALLTDANIRKVGQNSESFDIPFTEYKLQEQGLDGILQGVSTDTMLVWHLLNSDLPKDLGTIGATYSDMPYWKDEGRAARNLAETMAYNCKDIHGTCDADDGMQRDLKAYDMEALARRVAAVQPVNRKMRRHGIKKDWQKSVLWAVGMRKKADEMERTLKAGLGRSDFSVESPKQLMQLLYKDMGLPVQYSKPGKGKESKPTVNADALEALVKITGNKILQNIIDIRSLRKYASTYCDVQGDENGFVHMTFSNAKAANGRFNSYDPNMQNVPLELREMYIPDSPDHVLISADWSQVEWRNAIVGSADRTGLEILVSGRDNHRSVASEVLAVDYNDITDDQRHGAKFILYGLAYGRGARSIAAENNRSLAWVDGFINRFQRKFSGYWSWRERQLKFVEKNNFLSNPFNRRRWWFTQMATEVYNFWPSSTAADMMIDVLTAADAECPKGARIVLTVHDEVVACAHRDVAKETYLWLRTHMQRTWPQVVAASADERLVKEFYPNGWYVDAEPEFGYNWRECKKGNKALKKEILG